MRELAATFNMRVDMRQIGARQEAASVLVASDHAEGSSAVQRGLQISGRSPPAQRDINRWPLTQLNWRGNVAN